MLLIFKETPFLVVTGTPDAKTLIFPLDSTN